MRGPRWNHVPPMRGDSMHIGAQNPSSLSYRHGTLVIGIPAKDGILLAADSRSVGERGVSDDSVKVAFVDSAPHIAFAATGCTEFGNPSGRRGESRHFFSVMAVVSKFLRAHRFSTFDPAMQKALWESLCTASKNAVLVCPAPSEAKQLGQLYTVLLVEHDGIEHRSALLRISVGLTPGGEIQKRDGLISLRTFVSGQTRTLTADGASDYFATHVYQVGSVGRSLLGKETCNYLDNKDVVGNIERSLAARVAEDLIKATSLASEMVPPESGVSIGGPARMLFVDGVSKPHDPLRS